MSAVLGIFTFDARVSPEDAVRSMLGRARQRGDERAEIHREAGAALAVSRYAWELDPDSRSALLAADGECVVAADAALYYRDDLRRRLAAAGVMPTGGSAGELILAAYRAWGLECPDQLEGDFAFVIWDRRTQRVLCARDPIGTRSLFYAELEGALVVASTALAVVEHPACSGELNLTAVAESVAGLFNASQDSCYRGVRILPAGSILTRIGRSPVRSSRYWHPPAIDTGKAPPFEEAAEQLRALLTDAVAERLASVGATSVWLSGGWDSTAVFAAGKHSLRDRDDDRELRPVSMSYPPGDAGREDETILEVAGFWQTPVHWLHIDQVALLPSDTARAAADRELPFAHLFESWNRTVARGSRDVGCRIAFIGSGGDELFSMSSAYMADLLRGGHWATLAIDWYLQQGRTLRGFSRRVAQPALPAWARRMAGVLRRGEPLPGNFEATLPEWMDKSFARRQGLLERERRNTPRGGYRSVASEESHRYLTDPMYPHVLSTVFALALEEGVEVRTPLYDRRVVEFAAARPRWERASRLETKRLLRRSMRGLVPDQVLAPRPERTGVLGPYLVRSMRENGGLFEESFRQPLLTELGIVDGAALRAAWNRFRDGKDRPGRLLDALHCELWLRAKLRPTGESRPVRAEIGVLSVTETPGSRV
ncbi:MAG: asparagine synthetase B family protein [Gemmatimonadaceae bacterium]